MRKYLFSTLMWCAGISLFAFPLSETKECASSPEWDDISSWQPMMGYADIGTNLSSTFFLAEGTFAGTGVGNIPDRGVSGCGEPSGPALEISFNVTGMDGDLEDISINITAVHTWISDVRAELFAPDGTSHILFSRTGATTPTGCGENANLGGTYNFTDAAAGGNWWAVSAPLGTGDNMPSGDYRTTAAGPQAAANSSPVTSIIDAFSGVADLNGTWILRVYDYGGGDTGSVSAANLTIETAPVAPTGCLTATWGQYPATNYTPPCAGGQYVIVSDAYGGEYTKMNVTSGTEYTFSSSIATDFITISDTNGTTVYSSGTGTVTWTAPTTEVVRFYTHADAACAASTTFRSRIVSCGEPIEIGEPTADCFKGDGGFTTLENGYGIRSSQVYRVADDFVVDAGTTFTLEEITMNVLSATAVTNAILNIRADNAGVPGAVVNTATMAPTSSTQIGTMFGFPQLRLVFDLGTAFELTEGTYWFEVTAANAGAAALYWEVTSAGDSDVPLMLSNDSGATWVADDSGFDYNGVFFVAGECAPLVAGCLDAENGQWPTSTYTPICAGLPEVVTANGWTGEFSMIAVTNGTEYTFTVSDPTYFITIGDEAGENILASGTGSVTWTADLDGEVRFYAHFNSDCDWDDVVFLERHVQCGEPFIIEEPDYPCFQGDGLASNGPENGYGVDPTDIYRVADDFTVDAGTQFTIHEISLNALSDSEVTDVTFNIHENNAGSPGAIVETVTMTPTEANIFGAAFGFAAYNLVFELATPIELTEGTYWLEPLMSNDDGSTVYWEMSSTGSSGAIVQLSNTSGTTWVPDDSGDNFQAVFFVAGECEEVVAEGCLDAENGQWPTSTYTPLCAGSPEVVTANGWTGEFSMIAVTNGTEYTFTVSDPTYFITIGDELGENVLASGTGSVTWTAPADQLVRFYTHFDSDCNWDDVIFLERHIQCGEPFIIEEPDYPCFQGDGLASNGPENGYGVNPTDIYRVADDFIVDAGTQFTIHEISLNALSDSEITDVTFNVHANDAGSPGEILETVTMTPTESNIFGAAFGFAAYNLVFELTTPFVFTEGTYWLEPQMSNDNGSTVYWEMSSTGSNGAIVQLSNTSGDTWVPDDSGDNFQAVFFVAGECEEVILEGCLDAENGQYPSGAAIVPNCVGTPQGLTGGLAWTGEYSLVQVTAGTEYIFSLSDTSYFVTIGNEDGTAVLASGTGSVTWTAPSDQAVRFYAHFDSDCNWDATTFLERFVQCGDIPPPPEACDDNFVPSNNLENGLFFGGDTDQSLAVDVAVGDTGFTVYGVDLNVFTDGNTDLDFTVTFYEDDGGLPGTVHALTTASIYSSEFIGNAFGFDVYNYVIDFATDVDLDANSTYWMQVESDGLAWEATSASVLGSGLVFSNTNTGGVWTVDPVTDLVYALVCEELGVSDMNSFDFAYYPNPVKDVLNIDAKKAISNVSVSNLAGQQVMNKVNVNNGQVDVTSLTPGVYVFRVTLEGGQVETFKIIKK